MEAGCILWTPEGSSKTKITLERQTQNAAAHLHSGACIKAERQDISTVSGHRLKGRLVWGSKWQSRLWVILSSDPHKVRSDCFCGLLLNRNLLCIWNVNDFIVCLLNYGDSSWATLGQVLVLPCTPWILTYRGICSYSKLHNIKALDNFRD